MSPSNSDFSSNKDCGSRLAIASLLCGLLCTGCFAGAGNPSLAEEGIPVRSSEVTTKTITLIAKIDEFKESAAHDDFADGTSQAFDVNLLTVIAPESHKGRRIRVLHGFTPPADSGWRKAGGELSFEIQEALLEGPEGDFFPVAFKRIEFRQ